MDRALHEILSCFTVHLSFLQPDFQLFTSLARFLLTIFEDLDCIKIHFAEGLFVFPQGATWLMVVLEKKNVLCNFKLFILSLLPVNYPATVIVLCLNT